jgi:hypothetical protein
VNPDKGAHLPPLFNWLRRWGCRQFAIADEHIARKSLATWWVTWRRRLPPIESTLDEIDDAGLDTIAGAFEELRGLQASWQHRETGRVARTFGPAGAAKTLYAIRPNACSPWDEAIRRALASVRRARDTGAIWCACEQNSVRPLLISAVVVAPRNCPPCLTAVIQAQPNSWMSMTGHASHADSNHPTANCFSAGPDGPR